MWVMVPFDKVINIGLLAHPPGNRMAIICDNFSNGGSPTSTAYNTYTTVSHMAKIRNK